MPQDASTRTKGRSGGAGRGTVAARAPRLAEGVRLSAYLQAAALGIRKTRSADRTRLRLLGEGAALLETTGFRDLNVEEICRAADLAKGTFYIHFVSKDVFLSELTRFYVEFEVATVPARDDGASRFAQLRDFEDWYERTFALNVGVLRCLVQMAEVDAGARALWEERNRRLVDLQCERVAPASGIDPKLARLALRIAGGMVDQSLFERHQVQVGPGRDLPDDADLLVELHTLLLYRALHGCDPAASELGPTRPLLRWRPDDGSAGPSTNG